MRNKIGLILLFLSWPVCVIHRYWNKDPIVNVEWIRYDHSVSMDKRWYFVDNELMLSALFITLAFVIVKNKTNKLKVVLWAIIIVELIDFINYWLWFRRNEDVLWFEGMIMFLAAILILKNDATTSKSTHA